MMNIQSYADLEIRILEHEEAGYPVRITLVGGQESPHSFLCLELLTGDRKVL